MCVDISADLILFLFLISGHYVFLVRLYFANAEQWRLILRTMQLQKKTNKL